MPASCCLCVKVRLVCPYQAVVFQARPLVNALQGAIHRRARVCGRVAGTSAPGACLSSTLWLRLLALGSVSFLLHDRNREDQRTSNYFACATYAMRRCAQHIRRLLKSRSATAEDVAAVPCMLLGSAFGHGQSVTCIYLEHMRTEEYNLSHQVGIWCPKKDTTCLLHFTGRRRQLLLGSMLFACAPGKSWANFLTLRPCGRFTS